MRLRAQVSLEGCGADGSALQAPGQTIKLGHLDVRTRELVALWAGPRRPSSSSVRSVVTAIGGDASGFDAIVAMAGPLVDDPRATGRPPRATPAAPVAALPASCLDDHDVAKSAAQAHPLDVPRTAPLIRRRSASVGIVGLGRLGGIVALALVDAGIGALRLDDPRTVDPADTGLGVYGASDIGLPRAPAAAARLAALSPGTEITAGGVARTDLVVLVAARVSNPTGTARLISEGVPHLMVTYGALDSEVGPLVIPGTSACANCVDLHRATADPDWPARWQELRRETTTQRTPLSVTLALRTAAAIAQIILDEVDSGAARQSMPDEPSTSLTITVPSLQAHLTTWPPHDDCGCRDMAPASGVPEQRQLAQSRTRV